MVEVLEYALVILSSTVIVGFSLASYGSFSGAVAQASDAAAASAVSTGALDAIEHGRATVTVTLTSATISCNAGILSFDSPGFSSTQKVPSACSFRVGPLNGVSSIRFVFSGGELGVG